ncbi:hypothetical protein BCR43DRAFT_495471 [Syncephalastrum racemosum]|uniref:C2H2-type domain-containing protein n=1 Tax=Syncephalastrum racemosum TaxID=13706 RepID=A0A1X2H5W2_SYNRA|nr:hypothetical protein BCR43DRAFT_495471 [Syncephalastrum racemosum]
MSYLIDGLAPNASKVVHSRRNGGRSAGGAAISEGRHRKSSLVDFIDLVYSPLECPLCQKVSTARSDMAQHMMDQHRDQKLFSCIHPTCEHAYSSRAGLRYHLEHAHTVVFLADKKKQVVLSNKKERRPSKAARKVDLPPSMEEKLNRIYDPKVCPACHERFPRKTHVVHHLKEAHDGEEAYKCIIPECSREKSYATRDGLLYHLSSVHGSNSSS